LEQTSIIAAERVWPGHLEHNRREETRERRIGKEIRKKRGKKRKQRRGKVRRKKSGEGRKSVEIKRIRVQDR
jgi:hypothetical protein